MSKISKQCTLPLSEGQRVDLESGYRNEKLHLPIRYCTYLYSSSEFFIFNSFGFLVLILKRKCYKFAQDFIITLEDFCKEFNKS